jgi:hypothetical protein
MVQYLEESLQSTLELLICTHPLVQTVKASHKLVELLQIHTSNKASLYQILYVPIASE